MKHHYEVDFSRSQEYMHVQRNVSTGKERVISFRLESVLPDAPMAVPGPLREFPFKLPDPSEVEVAGTDGDGGDGAGTEVDFAGVLSQLTEAGVLPEGAAGAASSSSSSSKTLKAQPTLPFAFWDKSLPALAGTRHLGVVLLAEESEEFRLVADHFRGTGAHSMHAKRVYRLQNVGHGCWVWECSKGDMAACVLCCCPGPRSFGSFCAKCIERTLCSGLEFFITTRVYTYRLQSSQQLTMATRL
jgi:hypothetical protein